MQRPRVFLRHVFLWGCVGILAVALGFAPWAVTTGQWTVALVWAAIASVAAAVIAFRHRLAMAPCFLLALAAAINAAGYSFTLWHEDTLFDEAVHGFTSFAGMIAIGWAIRGHADARRWSGVALFAVIVAAGLLFGLMWEGFEWLMDMIGSPRDTLTDLIADGVGAVAASALVSRYHVVAADSGTSD